MLTPEDFDPLLDPISELFEEFSIAIIQDIARRISKMGVSATSAWQTQRLIESGQIYQNVLKELETLTGLSRRVLAQQFKKAGVKSIAFDDKIYKLAGLKPLPLNLAPHMQQILIASINKTHGYITNLTRSTAVTAQQKFIHALDVAHFQVVSGGFSPTTAIRNAVKEVGFSGMSVLYPSGHVDKLDVAVRRAVLTGTAQTTHTLQWQRAEEMKQDLVQVSEHVGARPSHAIWQGKIYSRSGNSQKYPDFETETGYGTGAGLGGYNCRHSFYPFFEGISKNAYTQAMHEETQSAFVTYNGQKMSVYEALQQQRSIERRIREWKRQAAALEAAGLENSFELGKVKEWQAQMRSFIAQTGLVREYSREQV